MIDSILREILAKFLKPPIKSSEETLIDGDNPLSTFSARIKVLYRLGIISEELKKDLDQIRKIRNYSAHNVDFELQNAPIRDHCKELKKTVIKRHSYIICKQRYYGLKSLNQFEEIQSIFITILIILNGISIKMNQTIGFKDFIEISKK